MRVLCNYWPNRAIPQPYPSFRSIETSQVSLRSFPHFGGGTVRNSQPALMTGLLRHCRTLSPSGDGLRPPPPFANDQVKLCAYQSIFSKDMALNGSLRHIGCAWLTLLIMIWTMVQKRLHGVKRASLPHREKGSHHALVDHAASCSQRSV